MNAHTFPPPSPVKGEAHPGAPQVSPGKGQVAPFVSVSFEVPNCIDIDFPDGFAEAHPGADILTLGRLNAEQKADDDLRFDQGRARW